jgi:hypothetical protein
LAVNKRRRRRNLPPVPLVLLMLLANLFSTVVNAGIRTGGNYRQYNTGGK